MDDSLYEAYVGPEADAARREARVTPLYIPGSGSELPESMGFWRPLHMVVWVDAVISTTWRVPAIWHFACIYEKQHDAARWAAWVGFEVNIRFGGVASSDWEISQY